MKYKLGFLGVGVMAGGMLNNIVNNINKLPLKINQIAIYDLDREKLLSYEKQGITLADDMNYLFNNCEFVLLGVKPQTFLESIKPDKSIKSKIIISIMAGIQINILENAFGLSQTKGFIRMMPNLPCTIGEGIIAITSHNIKEQDFFWAKQVFSSCGDIIEINENKFDAVTSISGSGPAYVFYFIQSLINAGIKEGLTEEESKRLALKTFSGSVSFVQKSPNTITELIDKVCSKGGTTIEAINVFNEKYLDNIIEEAIHACKKKSEILSTRNI